MKFDKRNSTKNSDDASAIKLQKCLCADSNGLFVPSRQVSFIVAGVSLLLFFSLVAGYFWGQRSATQLFLAKMDQNAFADQIYSSVCALTDQKELVTFDDTQCLSSSETIEVEVAPVLGVIESSNNRNQTTAHDVTASDRTSTDHAAEKPAYYAQLVGFGTSRAAYRCAERLKKNGFPVKVKKRQSRTSKGRLIYWYQVVTERLTDKMELSELVDRIVKQERLKDTRIVQC